ncbi:hypothetical protein GB937_001171 [Aspergillus fischeri]|nr:hypothetical protein GB937_001171 [Aspergillus fischeri]
MDSNLFLPYAALHWALHYRLQDASAARQLQTNALVLCNVTDPRAKAWIDRYFDYGYENAVEWTPLILATYLGLPSVVQALLDSNTDATVQDDEAGAALWLATLMGHEQVVQILLNCCSISVASQSEEYSIALHFATKAGRDDIVEMLEAAHTNPKALLDYAFLRSSITSPASVRIINQLFLDLMRDRGWKNLPHQAQKQLLAYPPRKKLGLIEENKLSQIRGARKATRA